MIVVVRAGAVEEEGGNTLAGVLLDTPTSSLLAGVRPEASPLQNPWPISVMMVIAWAVLPSFR